MKKYFILTSKKGKSWIKAHKKRLIFSVVDGAKLTGRFIFIGAVPMRVDAR